MASGFGTIQVKISRGTLTVQGMGETPRGQRYIRQSERLKASRISDPQFKSEMAAAIAKLFDQSSAPG